MPQKKQTQNPNLQNESQGFKTESGRKTKVAHSPSVAFGASSLSEGAMSRCVFFPSCRRGIFCLFFGAFRTIPHPPRTGLPQGSRESVRFSALCRRESKGKIQDFKTQSQPAKTKDFRRSFFSAPQSDTGRLRSKIKKRRTLLFSETSDLH